MSPSPKSCISAKTHSGFKTISVKWLLLLASYKAKCQPPLLSTSSEQKSQMSSSHNHEQMEHTGRCTCLTKELFNTKKKTCYMFPSL